MDQHEHLKLCFARYCEQHRDEHCPNLVYDKQGKKVRITWAECFERRVGISLADFRAREPKGVQR